MEAGRTIARLSKIVGVAIAVLLLLALAAFFFLATPIGERWAERSIVEAALPYGATVTMRSIEVHPLRLEVRAEGVVVRNVDADEDAFYAIEA